VRYKELTINQAIGEQGEMEIYEEDAILLEEHFSEVEEPRRTSHGHNRHKLIDMLVIGYSAILRGYGEGYEDMEEFGLAKEDFFKGFLELPNGIPDESTFRRVIQRLNPAQAHKSLENWLVEKKEREKEGEGSRRAINIDGKVIRGSRSEQTRGIDVVSAWDGEEDLVLGEAACSEKSNEITAIPELLDTLEIEGDVVTIDAMGLQEKIAKKIREKEAHYLIAVKDNQPILHEEIGDFFEGLESGDIRDLPEDVWQSDWEKKHGRLEKREVRVVTDIDWLTNKEKWKDLKTIIQYRTYRQEKGKEMVKNDQYYISSADYFADEFGKYIRGHWSIENRPRWCLDVIFGEDKCRARTENAALVLNVLRKMALKHLRSLKIEKKRLSTKHRMLRAALNDDFLYKALFGE
jgi:predicted transposase YbfD/YdcC